MQSSISPTFQTTGNVFCITRIITFILLPPSKYRASTATASFRKLLPSQESGARSRTRSGRLKKTVRNHADIHRLTNLCSLVSVHVGDTLVLTKMSHSGFRKKINSVVIFFVSLFLYVLSLIRAMHTRSGKPSGLSTTKPFKQHYIFSPQGRGIRRSCLICLALPVRRSTTYSKGSVRGTSPGSRLTGTLFGTASMAKR